MNEVVGGSRGDPRFALVAILGIVLGSGAFAWLKSRRGETALEGRTRARLLPAGRGVPNPADRSTVR